MTDAAQAVEARSSGKQYRATGWIVLNVENRTHRVFAERRRAKAIVDGWPRQMRLMPMVGHFDVDQPFVDICCELFR